MGAGLGEKKECGQWKGGGAGPLPLRTRERIGIWNWIGSNEECGNKIEMGSMECQDLWEALAKAQ